MLFSFVFVTVFDVILVFKLIFSLQFRITLLGDLPVQVDGEPWIQPSGQVVVLRSALKVSHCKLRITWQITIKLVTSLIVTVTGQLLILLFLQATMLKKSKNKMKRRDTEPSIYFPNHESLQPQSPSADGDSSGPS